MGGIAGTQTMTMVIRGMALDQIGKSNFRWLLGKEVMVGLLNGLIWASVVAMITILWFKDNQLGLIIAIAMLANQVIASFCGVMVPMVLRRMQIRRCGAHHHNGCRRIFDIPGSGNNGFGVN